MKYVQYSRKLDLPKSANLNRWRRNASSYLYKLWETLVYMHTRHSLPPSIPLWAVWWFCFRKLYWLTGELGELPPNKYCVNELASDSFHICFKPQPRRVHSPHTHIHTVVIPAQMWHVTWVYLQYLSSKLVQHVCFLVLNWLNSYQKTHSFKNIFCKTALCQTVNS